MQEYRQGSKFIEDRMNFIQKFLQKKYGFGILFFVIIVLGILAGVKSYSEGKKDGAKSAKEEISTLNSSLKNLRANDSIEMYTLRGRVAYYKKLHDTCNEINSRSFNVKFEEKLLEMDRLNRIMERRIQSREILNENNKNLLPK